MIIKLFIKIYLIITKKTHGKVLSNNIDKIQIGDRNAIARISIGDMERQTSVSLSKKRKKEKCQINSFRLKI